MHAILAGLTTLDVIHALDHEPDTATKTTSIDHAMAAGGPATNAAVTIAALEAAFIEEGGYSEQLATERLRRRKDRTDPSDPTDRTDLKPPGCPKCGSLTTLRIDPGQRLVEPGETLDREGRQTDHSSTE